jgi:hypothetical protein
MSDIINRDRNTISSDLLRLSNTELENEYEKVNLFSDRYAQIRNEMRKRGYLFNGEQPLKEPTTQEVIDEDLVLRSFHWGAFFLSPLWCLSYKKVGLGILIWCIRILGVVRPNIGLVAYIVNIILGFHVGMTAYKHLWAVNSLKYSTKERMIKSQIPWTVIGIIVGVLDLLLVVISFKNVNN